MSHPKHAFRFPLLAAASVAAIVCAAHAQPTFTLLGTGPCGVSAISADGSTIVGSQTVAPNISHPFKWSPASPVVGVDLGVLTPNQSVGASAVNADGTLIVGYGYNTTAFRWRPSTGLTPMSPGALPYGVSADGSVIVGKIFQGSVAAIWTDILGTQPTPPTLLPIVGFNALNDAYAISADNTIVVGNAIDASSESSSAAFWLLGNGQLLDGSPTLGSKAARAITPDGRIIVGCLGQDAFAGGAAQAARWDNGIPIALGKLPGNLGAVADAVSADGSVIVGHHFQQPYNIDTPRQPFLWTPQTGLVDLQSLLLSVGTIMPSGTLTSARGVSADGRTIVGNGTFGGVPRGWMLTLPPATYPPQLLSPLDGQTTLEPPLTLSWSGVAGATFYDITFVINSGAPIVVQTTGTSIYAPPAVIAHCQTVQWGVVAHLPTGTLASYPVTRTFSTLKNGDHTRDNIVNVTDIFHFITDWFSGRPSADINGNGLAVSDIFDFLAQWFAGCP